MSAEIHVRWMDAGQWGVTFETKNNSMWLGNVAATKSGGFSPTDPKDRGLEDLDTLVGAARRLYVEEFDKNSHSFAVRVPFQDESGP